MKYERLTDKNGVYENQTKIGKMLNKLAEFENAEENGTIVRLPSIKAIWEKRIIYWFVYFINELGAIDNYIFSTKAEAEAKLKELQNGTTKETI